MKNIIKKLIRSLWRISAPVHRPLIRKFDNHALQLLRQSPLPPGPPADLDLVLNSLVRELVRLQMQVEVLQQQIDGVQPIDRDAARPESQLSVVAEIG
jgi:hypothetical protein